MRISKSGAMLAAVTLSFGMVAVACGDSGGSSNDGVTIHTVKPQNSLIPGTTTENGGGRIIESMFTGLYGYNPDNGSPVEAAGKIETTDQQHYTVTVKKGWKFHDGTPLKAKNFVDAWNYTAYTPNAQLSASFMADIQGYDKVHTADPDADGPQEAPQPETDKMSGLEVVNDTTFKVTLNGPKSVFKSMLAYSAFMPLPDVFFSQDDHKTYLSKPIGNGPFKVVSQDTKGVQMERFGDYQGNDKAHVKKLTWRYYTNDLTVYRDIQNNKLDFVDQIDVSRLTVFKNDFPGRYSDKSVASIDNVAFPVNTEQYSDPRVRHAISMAINRPEIAATVLENARQPADGYVNPSIDGYQKNACGEFCKYDPDKAKQLLADAGGLPPDENGDKKIQIWYNTDGPHKEWIEATCASIQSVLGFPCEAQPTENFADLRAQASAGQFKQMFRNGWQADYPSIENYMNPLYRTGGSSNDNRYSSPAVDAKLAEADSAPDTDAANKLYQEAEDLVIQDMPVLPLFFRKQQAVWSENVENVIVDWRGALVVSEIERK
jgi:oligopeptide transport system substrate-binding protein